jgi:hypothetical protein
MKQWPPQQVEVRRSRQQLRSCVHAAIATLAHPAPSAASCCRLTGGCCSRAAGPARPTSSGRGPSGGSEPWGPCLRVVCRLCQAATGVVLPHSRGVPPAPATHRATHPTLPNTPPAGRRASAASMTRCPLRAGRAACSCCCQTAHRAQPAPASQRGCRSAAAALAGAAARGRWRPATTTITSSKAVQQPRQQHRQAVPGAGRPRRVATTLCCSAAPRPGCRRPCCTWLRRATRGLGGACGWGGHCWQRCMSCVLAWCVSVCMTRPINHQGRGPLVC